jgi:hypothetical protein
MNESRHKRTDALWLHVQEVLEKTKLTCRDTNPSGDHLWNTQRELTGIRHEEISRMLEILCILTGI